MQAQGSHEILVHIYHITRHDIPKDTASEFVKYYSHCFHTPGICSCIHLFTVIYLTNQQMKELPTYLPIYLPNSLPPCLSVHPSVCLFN